MKALLLLLPALVCHAQDPDLPRQLAKAQRLGTEQLLTLQARLAADPAPAEQKSYDQQYLAYCLASRGLQTDPKGTAPALERLVKELEPSRDPERMALLGACLGLKISLSPMSGMTLSPQAMALFDQALALSPDNPRILTLRAVHVLHTPAFFGGGAKVAIPILTAAAGAAAHAPAPADPWAPAWGRVDSLSWLALAQAQAHQIDAAKASVEQARALDPDNGFLDRMVLPLLKESAR
jgi:tetratricopeptide (TPR) repeat protein